MLLGPLVKIHKASNQPQFFICKWEWYLLCIFQVTLIINSINTPAYQQNSFINSKALNSGLKITFEF